MIGKQTLGRLAVAGALTLLLACGGAADGGAGGASGGAPAGGAEDETEALLEEVQDVEVPSEEEARAAAEAAIDESNADAEFERLKAEIEAGDG